MRIAIVGAAGMLGTKLAETIARGATIAGRAPERLILADVVPSEAPSGAILPVETMVVDASAAEGAARLAALRPEVIFHVAATAMGQANTDFAAGYRINFDTTRALLEAIRMRAEAAPRFVYASSIGVYGPPFPAVIPDDFPIRPDSSYGVQKAMCELLLDDYTRRGLVDGIGLRLPTLAIRPGRPTFGNSGFFSNIVREPLAGREAVLPVDPSVRHWIASPFAAVGFLIHAAGLGTEGLGRERSLTMPALSVSVEEEIEALRRVGGEAAVARIRRVADPAFAGAVYPAAFTAERATGLGFRLLEQCFDDIISYYMTYDTGRSRGSEEVGVA